MRSLPLIDGFECLVFFHQCEGGEPERVERTVRHPADHFKRPVELFDESCAALHPIAAVAIEDAALVANFSVVDMAADDPVGTPPARLLGDGVAERSNVLDRVLDPLL